MRSCRGGENKCGNTPKIDNNKDRTLLKVLFMSLYGCFVNFSTQDFFYEVFKCVCVEEKSTKAKIRLNETTTKVDLSSKLPFYVGFF